MRFFLLLLVLSLASVSHAATDSTKHRPIKKVIEAHKDAWMKLPGVTGVGETEKKGKPAIMIFVQSLDSATKRAIPKRVEGYPVVFEDIGIVTPLTK